MYHMLHPYIMLLSDSTIDATISLHIITINYSTMESLYHELVPWFSGEFVPGKVYALEHSAVAPDNITPPKLEHHTTQTGVGLFH